MTENADLINGLMKMQIQADKDCKLLENDKRTKHYEYLRALTEARMLRTVIKKLESQS